MNLAMMDWADQWPGSVALSNSNPEPFSLTELSEITGEDWHHLPLDHMDYQSAAGEPKLRSAMVAHLYPNHSPDDLICCAGAQEALYVAFNALIQAGDHVVTFTPAFEPLLMIPKMLDARITTLPLDPENEWCIDMDRLATALKDDAKLLVINFPHNPTGGHIDESTLNDILAMCQEHGVQLLSDEVFRGLESAPTQRLSAAASLSQQAISIGVMSKAYALPACRVGWILCQDKALRQKMITIKNHLSICISGLDANCMKRLLPHSESLLKRSVDIIETNRSHLRQWLSTQNRMQSTAGTASATCFVQIPEAQIFCQKLADEKGLLLVPGHGFATDLSGFRLSLGNRAFKKHMETWSTYLT